MGIPNKVARFVEQHIDTLVVAKSPSAQDVINGISSEQLRRIDFEIREWLIDDGQSPLDTSPVL